MRSKFKINFLSLAIAAVVAITPLTSCKKYEDGPYLSLSSKTARVANTWKAEKVTEGGQDKTSDYNDFRITFTKGGEYTLNSGRGIFDIATNGKWSFVNDKDDIQTTSDPVLGLSKTTTYTILKLTQNHLWIRNGDTEFHLIGA